MKFLDLNGLKHFWTKIKESFSTEIVTNSSIRVTDNKGRNIIPFLANHQIIIIDIQHSINLYNWFQKASRGGILEIVFDGGTLSCLTHCKDNNENSYMYEARLINSKPVSNKTEFLALVWNTYVRLIKKDDNTLVVAEYVANRFSTS